MLAITGVRSKATLILAHIRGPITPLITTHEPPRGFREHDVDQALMSTTAVQNRGLRVRGSAHPYPQPIAKHQTTETIRLSSVCKLCGCYYGVDKITLNPKP